MSALILSTPYTLLISAFPEVMGRRLRGTEHQHTLVQCSYSLVWLSISLSRATAVRPNPCVSVISRAHLCPGLCSAEGVCVRELQLDDTVAFCVLRLRKESKGDRPERQITPHDGKKPCLIFTCLCTSQLCFDSVKKERGSYKDNKLLDIFLFLLLEAYI